MTNNPRIIKETGDIVLVVVRHTAEIEPVEGGAEVVPLAQDRDPRQTRLEPLKADLFEEPNVVDDGTTPFLVVILVVVLRRAGPPAASDPVVADEEFAAHSITPSTNAEPDMSPSPQ